MAGGLLNLVAYGNQNVILNGNPSKTFFKTKYAKYTNFGLQKFRIDFNGQRNLRLTEPSVFTFTVPRYADLLSDTYLVLNLPNIWSPVMPPYECDSNSNEVTNQWQPYEFKWIDNLGSQMIDTIRFTVGGSLIQEMTGPYLYNLVERDFDQVKKNLYYEMTGNVDELNNPAFAFGRNNQYPSAFCGMNASDPEYSQIYNAAKSEPSIKGRQIYIPINIWFTLASKMAFPLVSLQYAELEIEVTIKPIQDLFTINEIKTPQSVNKTEMGLPIKPNFVDEKYQFYRFLQSPPDVDIRSNAVYEDKRTEWNTDIHLVSTYVFLSDDEIKIFASETQQYLIKETYYTLFENVVGTKKLDLTSLGLVSNWMWYLQRDDVSKRNQWSNYSNWPYKNPPNPPIPAGKQNASPFKFFGTVCNYPPDTLYNSGFYSPIYDKQILLTWSLLLDGAYRETEQPSGVVDYIEKYKGTSGFAHPGLYCYNFCLHTNPFDFQPSGAMNMSKFSTIQYEVSTIQPPLNADAQFSSICGNEGGEVIGTQMPISGIYLYQYNLVVLEERYNILRFQNGMAGLEYSR
jgi:hypothetical protein